MKNKEELKETLLEHLENLKDYLEHAIEYVENDEEAHYINNEIQELATIAEDCIDEWENIRGNWEELDELD